MVDFAGYYMPVQYSDGVKAEHHTVRNTVGVFDVSHMGEIFVKGEEAEDFLQYVMSNDVSQLSPGEIQYSCMPNGKGGIVDDLLIYKLAETSYLLVVNASNLDKDWAWLNENNKCTTWNLAIMLSAFVRLPFQFNIRKMLHAYEQELKYKVGKRDLTSF